MDTAIATYLRAMFTPWDMEMGIAMLMAFTVAVNVIPYIIRYAEKIYLLDEPDARQIQIVPVPAMGGIGIFLGLIIPIAVWSGMMWQTGVADFVMALTVLFVTGMWDDVDEMRPSKKFAIQLIAALVVVSGGIKIESLGGLFGIYELNIIGQYALTVLVIVGITNAVNLLDGIDGLAGGIGFINAMMFTLLFVEAGDHSYAIIAISMAGALLGFLRFNFNPARIFMGDTGSLVIGFTMAVLGIRFLQITPAATPHSMVMIYGILILPVFDTLRIFAVRMLKGKSPFSPDRNHIHHLLLKTGYNHKKAAIIMYTAHLILIGIGMYLAETGVHTLTAISILTGAAVVLSELLTIKRTHRINDRISELSNKRAIKQHENHLLTRINQSPWTM